uniref:Uncharacterized protein n=1 Tax=Alexandrium monilatum TaxID=311494 RepID=A0A7S4PTH3_9DINO
MSGNSARRVSVAVARDSFLHRAHADLEQLRALSSQQEGVLTTCACDAEAAAGRAAGLRRLGATAHTACRQELLQLPRPGVVLGDFESIHGHKGPRAALGGALDRLGLQHTAPALQLPEVGPAKVPARALQPWGSVGGVARAASELLERSRHLRAVQLQSVWRGYAVRRRFRLHPAAAALAMGIQVWLLAVVRTAVVAWRAAAIRAAHHAATTVARHVRGWNARRLMHCARRQEGLVTELRRRRLVQTLAASLSAWHQWVLRAQHWRARPNTVAGRSAPRAKLWELFPVEGKAAVARGQRTWALMRRALSVWVSGMDPG